MPKNTPSGLFIGIFSLAFGFAMIWYIWWLAIAGFAGILLTLIYQTTRDDTGYHIEADEVEKIESKKPQDVRTSEV